MSSWWEQMSEELRKPLTRGQALRYAWQATREKLRDYERLVYTEPYHQAQREELAAHVARLGAAVEEYIARHGEEPVEG